MRFRWFQNLNRLRIVKDICPLPGFPSHDAFSWKGVTANSIKPIIEHPNGYTVTDFQNRLITWHRTFTRDLNPPDLSSPSTLRLLDSSTSQLAPPLLPSSSLLHIHEWIPPTEPSPSIIDSLAKSGRRFRKLAMNHFEAVAILNADFTKHWSSQARRHLSAAKKNPNLKLRFGTLDEMKTMLPHSQVPKSLHSVFLNLASKHIEKHPADIEVLIATLNDQPVAGFVAGYCAEAKESSYLVGCFTGDGGKTHAMVALIEFWFQRCLDRGLVHANFGDIVGPKPFPLDDMIGYSTFKTHFNIHRVWMPGSRWHITFKQKT